MASLKVHNLLAHRMPLDGRSITLFLRTLLPYLGLIHRCIITYHAVEITRRETFRRGLAATSLLALVAGGRHPRLGGGGNRRPVHRLSRKDYKVNANPDAANRFLDIRKIDGQITPNDQFFFIQHYNRPEIDGNAYRLKLTGMVNKPMELSLADLKAMKSTELVNGYECSGNSGRFFQGLSSSRSIHRRAVESRAEASGCRRQGSGSGLLRHRSRQRRRRLPREHLQTGTTVWPQHHARTCDETRAAAGLRAERSAADARSGLSRCGSSCRAGTASPT